MEKKQKTNMFDIQGKCHICNSDVMINIQGNGDCEYCGWRQGKNDSEFPNEVIYPNVVSYFKAKMQVAEGKKIMPSFEDFIEAFKYYCEMEFFYKSKKYGLVETDEGIGFYEWDAPETLQNYNNLEEFITNANINGKLLKSIWHKVEYPDYM